MTLYCKPRGEKAGQVIVRQLAGAEHLHAPFQRSDAWPAQPLGWSFPAARRSCAQTCARRLIRAGGRRSIVACIGWLHHVASASFRSESMPWTAASRSDFPTGVSLTIGEPSIPTWKAGRKRHGNEC